jgi:hypothetical protein
MGREAAQEPAAQGRVTPLFMGCFRFHRVAIGF